MKKIHWIIYIVLLPLAMLQDATLAIVEEYVIDMMGAAAHIDFAQLKCVSVLALWIVNFAQWCVKASKIQIIQNRILDIRMRVMDHILNQSTKSITEEKSAYTSMLLNDIKMLENDYYPTWFLIVEQAIKLCIGIYMIITRSLTLGMFLVIGFLLPMLIPKVFDERIKKNSAAYSKSNEHYTDGLDEVLKGIATIKNYHVEDWKKMEIEDRAKWIRSSSCHLSIMKESCNILIWGLSCMVMVIGLFYGAYLVFQGQLSMGAVVAVLQMANGVSEPVVNISSGVNVLQSVKPIRKKIFQYTKEEKHTVAQDHHFNTAIELQDVCLRIDDFSILKNINITFAKGDKVLLLGTNGSGKSSLLKVLSGELSPSSGRYMMDGKLIAEGQNLSNVSVVSQNCFVFDDTLKQNITLHEAFCDEVLYRAIRDYGLTEVLKEKGEERLGKEGNTLSGGQRQRIEIARACIRNRDILLLDEAFSAIDKETARRLEERILQLDATIFFVTHRIHADLLAYYSKVVVLQEGSVVEYGTVDEVLSNPDSYVYTFL